MANQNKQQQKGTKRNKLSDSKLKSEIIAIFNSGITGKMEVFGTIRKSFTIARDRFTANYNTCYSEWGRIKEDADKKATAQGAEEAATIGLKSKSEKAMGLQAEIENIDNQLSGKTKCNFVVGNKIMKSHNDDVFMLPVQIHNQLRDRKLQYTAELNKMEGDYAPFKMAKTKVNGDDSNENISDDELLEKIKSLQTKLGE